jgi:hypothetical protein
MPEPEESWAWKVKTEVLRQGRLDPSAGPQDLRRRQVTMVCRQVMAGRRRDTDRPPQLCRSLRVMDHSVRDLEHRARDLAHRLDTTGAGSGRAVFRPDLRGYRRGGAVDLGQGDKSCEFWSLKTMPICSAC